MNPEDSWKRVQLFVGGIASPDKFVEPRPRDDTIWPKPTGGLWTSSWLGEERGSAWIQWCLSECYSVPDACRWDGTLLHPDPTANVYVIDTFQDLEDLLCGNQGVDCNYNRYPNFATLIKKYDAIHLTERGERETKFTLPENLYGWDVECTLWFRWKFVDVLPITLTIWPDD
jgi:hypothetical protein